MQPDIRDAALLWDMVEQAKTVSGFMQGRTLADFESDLMLRHATERCLEVLGEAARHVSPLLQQAHPEVPWARLIGLRNILAHEYGEILIDRIWHIATVSVPELLALLAPLVPPPPTDE